MNAPTAASSDPATRTDMGPLRFIKRTSLVNIIYGPIFGLAIMAGGIALLYKPGFVSSSPGFSYWLYDFPLGLIVLAAGLFVVWISVKVGRVRTWVYYDGLFHRGMKGEVRILFSELKAFNYEELRVRGGTHLNIYAMNFVDEQDRRVGFQVQPDGLKDKDLPKLRDELAEIVADKLEAKLDSGVPWLPGVEIRRDGLHFPGSGQPPLPFSPDVPISFNNGVCFLKRGGTTYQAPTASSNFYPGLRLVERAVQRKLRADSAVRS